MYRDGTSAPDAPKASLREAVARPASMTSGDCRAAAELRLQPDHLHADLVTEMPCVTKRHTRTIHRNQRSARRLMGWQRSACGKSLTAHRRAPAESKARALRSDTSMK